MKLKPDTDIVDFLKAVQRCHEDVVFLSNEQDQLNLKSMLSQYVFLTMPNQRRFWEAGEILCRSKEDQALLTAYFQ